MCSSITIKIADISCRVSSEDPALGITASGASRLFLADCEIPDILLGVDWGDLAENPLHGHPVFDSGSLWRLHQEDDTYCFTIYSRSLGAVPYKAAEMRKNFTSGRISVHRPHFNGATVVEPLEYPLDELIFAYFLALGKGIEVHACGILDEHGAGHLFIGQSGAGKTTMARICQNEPGIVVLSDDRIVVRRLEDTYWMYGTPWHGDAALASPIRAPLSGLYFLEKGGRNSLRPLACTEAMMRLFACSFPPFFDAQGISSVLAFMGEIVQAVPCFELTFVPSREVIEMILAKGS
jgi:hypothetical protein